MFKRLIIHIKNLGISIKWIFNNYIKFKNHLEEKGYYALTISKIWLWKEDARYFQTYNANGDCFFIKMKSEESVAHESKSLDYINRRNLDKSRFYPQIIDTNMIFNYNIYKNINGKKLDKVSFKKDMIEQIKIILDFFKTHNIVHRDIRPHNIMLDSGNIILLDFEHCVINGESKLNFIDLNKDYRPSNQVWDDAFSFKKIIDRYSRGKIIKKSTIYLQISNMVGSLQYESN